MVSLMTTVFKLESEELKKLERPISTTISTSKQVRTELQDVGRAKIIHDTGTEAARFPEEVNVLSEEEGIEVVEKLAGRLKYFQSNWIQIILDKTILSWRDYKIPFKTKVFQKIAPKEP